MATCGIISFRYSNHDGVTKVAEFWRQALDDLGFDTLMIAGDGKGDRLVPGISGIATEPVSSADIRDALSDCDIVIAENILSLPINLPACLAIMEILKGRKTILHHHDMPWQRYQHGHIRSLPADDPMWEHVVINDFTKSQVEALGIQATRIYNPTNTAPGAGDRYGTRDLIGIDENTLLVAHPTRSTRIKNVSAAVSFTEKMGGTYWCVGPPEEDYGDRRAAIFEDADCEIITMSNTLLGNPEDDMYAASDIIIFPSFWESFGLPPVEASAHGVPCAVGDYPIAEELRKLGLRWFYPWETGEIKDFFADPADISFLETNRQVVQEHFSFEKISGQIAKLLERRGWLP